MPFGITPLHVIVVLVVALIILGPRMLPRLGSAAGKSIRVRDVIQNHLLQVTSLLAMEVPSGSDP